MKNEYIAVLSLWKRSQWIEEQVTILRNQTLPPKEIWLCWGVNDTQTDIDEARIYEMFDKVEKLEDGGSIFSRFEMCSGYKDQYFQILDDDLFPTDHYMESCFDLLNFIDKEGIIGCGGRKFTKPGTYHPHHVLGVLTHFEHDVKVDIGTNGWLLTGNAIDCLLDNHDRRGYNNGEDIALSYLNRSLRDVDTYVTKQTTKTNACRYMGRRGVGEVALSHSSKHTEFYKQRNELLEYYQNATYNRNN